MGVGEVDVDPDRRVRGCCYRSGGADWARAAFAIQAYGDDSGNTPMAFGFAHFVVSTVVVPASPAATALTSMGVFA
jgi:hypothetical protein